ncbi:hypothetical protein niasHT_020350 [Heterodera trifolii]|uniref:Uncharacterized protein n=1 Tax=Heterodera trifolii TaxID=157864 RepID=A0ABD2JXR0_9BILA
MRRGGNVCCLRGVCVPSRVRFEAVGWTLAMNGALKDGVLLSLTDRGDHIRMDEFRAFRSQVDKIQRWPKERGHATIMRLASDQCARMFATSS